MNVVDEYIAGFPEEVQERLQKVRATIRKAAPDAEEAIKYGIAAYVLHGKNLIFFGGHKNHIGLYPVPRANPELADELAKYEGGKGTAQFPHDGKLPLRLITKIVKVRMRDNTAPKRRR